MTKRNLLGAAVVLLGLSLGCSSSEDARFGAGSSEQPIWCRTCVDEPPPEDPPPPAPTDDGTTKRVINSGDALYSAGITSLQRNRTTEPYRITLVRVGDEVSTMDLKTIAYAGNFSGMRTYEIVSLARKLYLLVSDSPQAVEFRTDLSTSAPRDRYELRDNAWVLTVGDGSVRSGYYNLWQMAGATIADVGEAYMQSLGSALQAMSTPVKAQSADSSTGCFDSGGFCSAEYTSCSKCAGSGGTGTGYPSGGDVSSIPAGSVCSGAEFAGGAFDFFKSTSVAWARSRAADQCTNGQCIGCCEYLNGSGGWSSPSEGPTADCACLVGDFFCTCRVRGKACSP